MAAVKDHKVEEVVVEHGDAEDEHGNSSKHIKPEYLVTVANVSQMQQSHLP